MRSDFSFSRLFVKVVFFQCTHTDAEEASTHGGRGGRVRGHGGGGDTRGHSGGGGRGDLRRDRGRRAARGGTLHQSQRGQYVNSRCRCVLCVYL